ncbi:MAG TPA: DUF2809 domain-containing protein [Planctomycetota bacterium]|nr:DUF2809 domain-containing protein [Planctomycetota bacterium]
MTGKAARLLAVAVVTLALGVGSRLVPAGASWWDKYTGDAAYASMVFVVIACCRGARPRAGAVTAAAVFCTLIECFQATGLPLQWGQSENGALRLFARFVLGSTFGWLDLPAYAFGIAVAALATGRAVSTADQ